VFQTRQDPNGQETQVTDEDQNKSDSEENASESEEDEGTKRYNEVVMKQGKGTQKVSHHIVLSRL
jgi:hypothetical protein